MKALIIAEYSDVLSLATRAVVAAASATKAELTVLVIGENIGSIADDAARISGVSQVLRADNAAYKDQLPENCAKLIQSIAADYQYVFAAASTFGKNLLPRVAALCDVEQISDIVAVNATDTFVRPIYAGNALATVQSADALKVITIRTSAFDAVGEQSPCAITELSTVINNVQSQLISKALVKSERPELVSADVVISGGRGMGSGDNFALIEAVADKLNAAIGASRAAVDAGFVSNDLQVGQTGKIIAPNLYIAVGISGAIQHLAGMKESKIIVAINKDEDAPIFQVADYGLVADLFDVLPELASKL